MAKRTARKSQKSAVCRRTKARSAAKKEAKAASAKTPAKPAAVKRPQKTAEAAAHKAETPPAVKVNLPSRKPAITVAPGARILGRNPSAAAAAGAPPVNREGDERRLTRREIEEIKDNLLLIREKILQGLKREINDYRERSTSKSADEADKASDAYDEDLSFEIASTSDEELARIEVALEKIANGTYGLCESCDKPISPSRLKAIPYATTCIACRDDEERMRKREESMTPWGLVGDEAEEEAE